MLVFVTQLNFNLNLVAYIIAMCIASISAIPQKDGRFSVITKTSQYSDIVPRISVVRVTTIRNIYHVLAIYRIHSDKNVSY